MAENGSPFAWQSPPTPDDPSEVDPTDENAVVFGWRRETIIDDLERYWWLFKRCDAKFKCSHADLLDGFHGRHYETRVAFDATGAARNGVVDKPNWVAGTGITITVSGSNITINADNNGDVTGPGSSTDGALAAFNGTTGKLLRNTAVVYDPNNGRLTWPDETVNTPTDVDLSANAQEDDYAGFAGATVIHVTAVHSGGSTIITGIAGGVEGRYLRIRNLSGTELVLDHDDSEGGSVDANHILLTGSTDLAVGDGEVVQLEYAGSRWRQI